MPRRKGRAGGFLFDLAILAVVASSVLAPGLIDAHAALQWTRYYAGHPPLKGGEAASRAGRMAARAIELGAPLPWAREAAERGLALARLLEAQSPQAALGICREVGQAIGRAESSRVRRLGVSGLGDEVHRLETEIESRGPAR